MVYAIDIGDPNVNPLARFSSIAYFLNVIMPLITIAASIFFLAMLLFGAFTFTTASGDPEKMKKAQKTLGFSIIGFVIVIFAYFFVKLLTRILNISSPLP